MRRLFTTSPSETRTFRLTNPPSPVVPMLLNSIMTALSLFAQALNTYGRSKIETEEAVRNAVQEWNLVSIIVRFSNVYGSPKDHADRVIPLFVKAALEGQPLAVSGKKIVDFTFLSDAASGVLLGVQRLDKLWKVAKGWNCWGCGCLEKRQGRRGLFRAVERC